MSRKLLIQSFTSIETHMSQEGGEGLVSGIIPGALEGGRRPQWEVGWLADTLTRRPVRSPDMPPDARLLLPRGWAGILGTRKLSCQQAAPSAAFC